MPKKILLAEDSVTMQKVIQMTFAAEDYTVTTASNVDEALARAGEVEPDLVIADLSMTGKNGYDLCAALREGGSGAPVLVLHGSAAPYDEEKGRTVGASGDLVKPFESQALIDVAAKLISATGAVAAREPRGPVESLAPPIGADIVIDAGEAAKPPAAAKPRATPVPKPAPLPTPAPSPAVAKPAPKPAVAPPLAKPAVAPPLAKPAAPAAPAKPAAPPVAQPLPAPVPAAAVKPPSAAPLVAQAPEEGEIIIEAEPPPPKAREPLPSFDVQPETATREETQPGMGKPLPPPPEGMPLPPGAPAVAGAPGESAEVAELKKQIAQLQSRLAMLEQQLQKMGGPQDAAQSVSREVVEQVVWEVVPELAETLIREEIDRLVEKRGK